MAQYWEDWSGQTVGEFPSGWTRRFAVPSANQWYVRESGGVKYLEAGLTVNGSSQRQMISLDAVDVDSSRADYEVVFKWQCASIGTSRPQMKAAGRASGDVTATYAYLCGFDNSGGGHRTQKYVNGTSTTLLAVAGTVTAATDYITRSRVSGSNVKLKTWLASETEPTAWTVETTDTALTAAGWVGLFCLNTTYVYKIAFVGIATGTDSAPTEEPVADTVDELSAQDITTGEPTITSPVLNAGGIEYELLAQDITTGAPVISSPTLATVEVQNLTLVVSGDTLNAHPSNSSIDNAGEVSPTVNITVRVIYSNWRQFVFKLEGATGKRPVFKINPTGYVNTFNSAWRPWYSYDGFTWLRFDTPPVNNTTWNFQHSEAFISNSVYVAYQPAWQVARAPWLINELAGINSSLVHEVDSAPSYEYGTALTAQTDELGNTVPSQKMYAFGVWDSTLNPADGSNKRNVVITGGVHAGEHVGSWAMEGFLRYLFSGTEKATTLLRNYRFYIYPLLNPMGRYMGHFRGQRDTASLTLDPNRDYPVDNSPSVLQSSTFFRNMIATDLGGQKVAFSLDFHASWGSDTSFYFYSDPSVDENAIYLDEWHARIQAYSTGYTRTSSLLEVTVDQYVTRNYGPKHSYTPEMYESSAFSSGTDSLITIGGDWAKALADSPLSEMELPTLESVVVLSAANITAGIPSIGSPILRQVHILGSQNISAGTPRITFISSNTENPSLNMIHSVLCKVKRTVVIHPLNIGTWIAGE